jgi:hypothetical protein
MPNKKITIENMHNGDIGILEYNDIFILRIYGARILVYYASSNTFYTYLLQEIDEGIVYIIGNIYDKV